MSYSAASAAKGHRSRAFGKGLFALQQDHDGICDFLFIDGHQLVDIALYLGQGEIAGAANGNAVGDGCFRRQALLGRDAR